MAVFRVEKNANYTTMSNYHLRDKQLSMGQVATQMGFSSLQQFSQSSSQAAEAAEQLSEALQQQGAWNDDAATAFADAAEQRKSCN